MSRPLSTYYSDLIENFQELDHRDKIVMKDPDDVVAKDPIPDLEETYAYVRRDAIRRASFNEESDHPSKEPDQTVGAARPDRFCTHCNGAGHTKARCYELIGYPEWWDPAKAPSKWNSKPNHHVSVAVAEPPNNTPQEASSLIAKVGILGKALHTYAPIGNSTWIIDFGAINHMTFDVKHVHSMKPFKQPIVSTADGTFSPVIGKGSITLTKNLNLDSVLVVPSLNYNLLSVTQRTRALQRIVIFWPNLCVFKDIQTQRTIGYGIRRGKLYHLDLTPAMTVYLCSKRQSKFITDLPPPKGDASLPEWEEEDSDLMCRLWHSLEPHIGTTIEFYDTSKQIWDALAESFSQRNNVSRIFELYEKIFMTKQSGKSLFEYYSTLKSLWDKLLQHLPFTSNLPQQQCYWEDFMVASLLFGLDTDLSGFKDHMLLSTASTGYFPHSDSHDALTTQVSELVQTLRLSLPATSSTATLANSGNVACATLTSPSWILDSGASTHMSCNSSIFSDMHPINHHIVYRRTKNRKVVAYGPEDSSSPSEVPAPLFALNPDDLTVQ
ncbi:hypothetical protein RHSIM_RhsimUnG0047900 [Rhododendron simsii]|uniref:Retrovirus-related Pol polyprotein from transposon TNT 1-94-like beta-barrel domain-containing protein n=1 Tax=Rhododendron simsii TaxID=118357 RepID=A0A834L5I6_RHOSS|nr:hypothetical protein RHSIM_RhsimUnG0047900 [Rhododendron simsii]